MPPASASALASLRRLTQAPRPAAARQTPRLVHVWRPSRRAWPYQYRDRHRVALGEVQERSPVFNFRQAPSALGQRPRQFQPLQKRHWRHATRAGRSPSQSRSSRREVSRNFALVSHAARRKSARLRCSCAFHPIRCPSENRRQALRYPKYGSLPQKPQGRTAPTGFVQAEPLLCDVGECAGDVVQHRQQWPVMLE